MLKGTESRAGGVILLEEIFEFLVDRDSVCPTGRRVRAALDVAGEEFDAGEEAAYAAHVTVAVAADAVGEALQQEHALLVVLEGFQDGLELSQFTRLVRPEVRREGAVWREHDDEALPGGGVLCPVEAGQTGDEGEGRGREAEVAEKSAAGSHDHQEERKSGD
jgi:hypothetical protein